MNPNGELPATGFIPAVLGILRYPQQKAFHPSAFILQNKNRAF